MRVFYVAACKNALFLFSLQACNSLHSGKNNIASITIGIVLKTGITQTFLLLFWEVSYLDFRAVLYSLEGKPWHGNTHSKQCSCSTTKNHKHICSAKQISILKHIVSHPTLTHNTHFFYADDPNKRLQWYFLIDYHIHLLYCVICMKHKVTSEYTTVYNASSKLFFWSVAFGTYFTCY